MIVINIFFESNRQRVPLLVPERHSLIYENQKLLGIGQSKQLKAGHPCVHVTLSNLDKLKGELDFESKTDRELLWFV